MARSKYTKHLDPADEPPEETTAPGKRGKGGKVNSGSEEGEKSPDGDDAEFVSRSSRKRDSDAMKALGMRLAELSPKQLTELALGDTLYTAITDYQRITSNSAKRRQRGYIGGLLRDDNDVTEAIRQRHIAMTEHDADSKRIHHELEDWRERLIADDAALTAFLDKYRGANVQQLRALIRRARTAKDDSQLKLATRALYRKLADIAQA